MIRHNYRQKKKELHDQDIAEAQRAFQTQKDEKLANIYNGIQSSLLAIGTGHQGAERVEEEQCQQVRKRNFVFIGFATALASLHVPTFSRLQLVLRSGKT